MSKKTKQPKEIYYVYFLDEKEGENGRPDWATLDFEHECDSLEEAEQYVIDESNRYANEEHCEKSGEWKFFIHKEVKVINVRIDVKKTSEITFT
jgi:hypothetical protein